MPLISRIKKNLSTNHGMNSLITAVNLEEIYWKRAFGLTPFKLMYLESALHMLSCQKLPFSPNLALTLHFLDANWWGQHMHIRAHKTSSKWPFRISTLLTHFLKSNKHSASLNTNLTKSSWEQIFSWGGRQTLPFFPSLSSIHPSLRLSPAERLLLQLIIYK